MAQDTGKLVDLVDDKQNTVALDKQERWCTPHYHYDDDGNHYYHNGKPDHTV